MWGSYGAAGEEGIEDRKFGIQDTGYRIQDT